MFGPPEDLRRYAVLAGSGGMSAAAERLGITRNALAKTVLRLEESCGAPLVERLGQGRVRLTPLGAEVLKHARRHVREAEASGEAVRRAGRKASGENARGPRLRKTLRLPEKTAARIGAARAALPRPVTLNDWIVDAIHERLDRVEARTEGVAGNMGNIVRRQYPAILHGGAGEPWGLSFVDLPVHVGGGTLEAAVADAETVLAEVMDDLARDREAIPAPTPVADIPAAVRDGASGIVLIAVHVPGNSRS